MGSVESLLATRNLGVVDSGERIILRDVTFGVPGRMITAIIGPSGAGKTTLLKCLNRLIDLTPQLKVTGEVLLHGVDVRERDVDPDDLRRRVGIVFQQPVTFPGSIRRNVVFAARKIGVLRNRSDEAETLERCLIAAGLWSEVKDRLEQPAGNLSVGQQQRLAIARTLAGNPEVLLMDEPTSALDPRATAALEETIHGLKATKTVVMVTHHLEQARRLADWIACLCPKADGAGEMVEANRCEVFFDAPSCEESIAFLDVASTKR